MILKDFSLFILMWKLTSHCDPTLHPGIVIWKKKPENLHHLKMLPQKFRIFLPNWFWEDFFEKPTFFQWIFIISSLKNAVPFVLRILNPTSPKNTLGQVLLNLAKWFWWRSQECLKTNKRTDWRTEAKQKFIRKAQLSFQLSSG